jgi:hypothetical protein
MPKRRRGRPAPEYGPRICPFCARKLYFNLKTQRYYCECGWTESLPKKS